MGVVVVGAGLAGLTAAGALLRAGFTVQVLEARRRVGGRLMTVAPEGGKGWLDLGATWLWEEHRRVRALAAELGIPSFPQFAQGRSLHEEPDGTVVEADEPAPVHRLAGGAQALCERLAEALPAGTLTTGRAVTAIRAGASLEVTTESEVGAESTLTADSVVVAIPPRLAVQNVEFQPALPEDLAAVMEATETWMAGAVKCVAVYDSPFWRGRRFSGTVFSHLGPLHEVHDGSTDEVAALWGLLAPDPALGDLGPEQRVPLVLAQLERVFGPEAADPSQYIERDWSGDPYTNEAETPDGEPLEYGHPAFSRPAMDGRLVWAGAETEAEGGGHMEGAIRSGERAAATVAATSGAARREQ